MLYYKIVNRDRGDGVEEHSGFLLSNGSMVPNSEGNRDYIDLQARITASTASLLDEEDAWPEDAELPPPPRTQLRSRGGVPIP